MTSLSRGFPLVLCLGFLVVTGCRTYGNDKYDTGPKTYDAIQTTVRQMDKELSRARADLRRLESAAETAVALQPVAERYRSYVESHEAALDEHREQAERLTADASYRTLHHVYGSIVTDRRLLRRQYARTTRKVWAVARDTTIPRKAPRDPSRYMITPVQFPRSGTTVPISMAEALRALEGTPGLQQEEQPASSE